MRVCVKFCGNCNPGVDTNAVLRRLKDLDDEMEFAPYSVGGCGALLVLSACPVDCADRPDSDAPVVLVSGREVNRRPCPGDLATAVLRELRLIGRRGQGVDGDEERER